MITTRSPGDQVAFHELAQPELLDLFARIDQRRIGGERHRRTIGSAA